LVPRSHGKFAPPVPVVVFGLFIATWVLALRLEGMTETSATEQRDARATGCRNSPRDLSVPVASEYRVVVFDRECPSAPRYTVNVSIIDGMEAEGPGNAFVAEASDKSAEGGRALRVFAFPRPGRFVTIDYDPRARVLSHQPSVNGVTLELVADSMVTR
jgi:hypothetical protein